MLLMQYLFYIFWHVSLVSGTKQQSNSCPICSHGEKNRCTLAYVFVNSVACFVSSFIFACVLFHCFTGSILFSLDSTLVTIISYSTWALPQQIETCCIGLSSTDTYSCWCEKCITFNKVVSWSMLYSLLYLYTYNIAHQTHLCVFIKNTNSS